MHFRTEKAYARGLAGGAFRGRLCKFILHNIADGKMFPSRGDLHVAPFQDEALYMEQINKVNFWYQDYFHGVNLSSLRDAAMKEYFRQPIVSRNSRPPLPFGHAEVPDSHQSSPICLN